MSKMLIAAQLYTLRDLLKDKSEEEIIHVLAQVKSMGYEAIQVSGVGEVTRELAEVYLKAAKTLELDICATHFNLEYMEENLEWIIELHQMWHCNYAGIGSMPLALRNPEGLDEFVKRCNDLGRELKKAGIYLVYHNHDFEFEKLDGKAWLQILLDGFDSSCVQLEIDTYWVQSGGGNPVTWIDKVRDHMGVVHLKDMRIVKGEQQFAEIGEGNMEWESILEACEKAEVKYAAVEQDSYTDDPLKSLKMSIDYLEKIM